MEHDILSKYDIGSIFPLYKEDMMIPTMYNDINVGKSRIVFSLCREAMFAIALKYKESKKSVLIPAYTCQTVIDPFIELGWTVHFYNIEKTLRIDLEDLNDKYESILPSMIVVHPFHGMELNEDEIDTLSKIKNKGCIIVEDITQCIYAESRLDVFDYIVGSYRKWFKSPDGGFLESHLTEGIEVPTNENLSFVSKQTDAMYLRGKYFETHDEYLKQISIRLNKSAVAEAQGKISLHKMANASLAFMETENHETDKSIRLSNYAYLHSHIVSQRVTFVCSNLKDVTTAPLYFPIYVDERAKLQKALAQSHVYAPVLWPIKTDAVLINENFKDIYSTILMIPIDQRYDVDDMRRIVKIINDYE